MQDGSKSTVVLALDPASSRGVRAPVFLLIRTECSQAVSSRFESFTQGIQVPAPLDKNARRSWS